MSNEMSADEYRATVGKPKRSKYGARKAERDGYTFDSQAEARRYDELRLLEQAGEIEGLVLQPPFPLEVNGVQVAVYRADFLYHDNRTGERVVEDVKGAKTPVYNLKKKLVKALHNIDITEVAA